MFKTLPQAIDSSGSSEPIILNLAAVRYFVASQENQIGKTIIKLVGGGSGDRDHQMAVQIPPDSFAGLFPQGSIFALQAWNSDTGNYLDSCRIYLSMSQVRSVAPHSDKAYGTVYIDFFDGSRLRVHLDQAAEHFLESITTANQ